MNESRPFRVGTVLFEGFELLDVFGPLQMLSKVDGAQLILLAENIGRVQSAAGPAAEAGAALGEESGFDLLLVPGGWGTRRQVERTAFLQELVRQCESARYVASVCTGSGLLAKAGVLDGKRATSNKQAFAWAKSQGPHVQWVAQARWVEDGKFFTSSGVSAGMDMALGFIERLFGKTKALSIATHAEYEWHSDSTWDPFAQLNGLV